MTFGKLMPKEKKKDDKAAKKAPPKKQAAKKDEKPPKPILWAPLRGPPPLTTLELER